MGAGMAKGRWKWALAWWHELSRPVQILSLMLVGLGTVLVIHGISADVLGLWERMPFTVNIVSSVVAACFGIPIALVVLRYLLAAQEERSEKLRVFIEARSVAERIRRSALACVPASDRNQAHLEEAQFRFWKLLQYFPEDLDDWEDLPVSPETYHQELESAITTLQYPNPGARFIGWMQLSENVDDVEEDWNYFKHHVQPRLRALSIPAYPTGKSLTFDQTLAELKKATKGPLISVPGLTNMPGYQPDEQFLRTLVDSGDTAQHRQFLESVMKEFDRHIKRGKNARGLLNCSEELVAWCENSLHL